ncbi:hypothetical protein SCLCIDRAFT_1216345 [Scleroderma citrinum Foug A]|uniref:Uncharacterized protein n=1 Tax=Scleroderma citrinum Foug A TaxID=1036808 RepID=A0A0C3DXZ0_9AGAM|nr:hypothetical protein SCLCIDRAFT_1216345 [Scleroderma citrinum Foug A]
MSHATGCADIAEGLTGRDDAQMKSDSAMKCRGRCNPRERLEYTARRVKRLRNPYDRIQRVHGCTKRHGQHKTTANTYKKVRAC